MEMKEVWPNMRDVYINSNLNSFIRLTSSSRRTEFKDVLQWNMSHMILKSVPISMRIVISYAIKWGIPFRVWQKSVETETTWLEFSSGGKAIVEQILAPEERHRSRRAWLWNSQSDIQVQKIIIWVRWVEIEKLWKNSPGLTVQPEEVF